MYKVLLSFDKQTLLGFNTYLVFVLFLYILLQVCGKGPPPFASKFIYIYEMHSFRLCVGLILHLWGFPSFAEQSLEDMKQTVMESQPSKAGKGILLLLLFISTRQNDEMLCLNILLLDTFTDS